MQTLEIFRLLSREPRLVGEYRLMKAHSNTTRRIWKAAMPSPYLFLSR